MQAHRRLMHSSGLRAALPRAARRLPAPLQRQQLRCLASSGSNEKSWSEIASEAGQLATDLVKKVGSTVSSAASKVAEAIVPSEQQEERPQQRQRRQRGGDVYRPEDAGFGGGLVGGLLGRAVGGVLRSAAGALAEQLQQAAQQVADVQDRAARVIEGSAKVRAALGGSVRVGPPMSQSSMSQSINGRVSKTVTLLMPVAGANGQTAQAQVRYVEGVGGASEQLAVTVRLPSGQVLELDGGSSPSTQTIDVEWRSVDDK